MFHRALILADVVVRQNRHQFVDRCRRAWLAVMGVLDVAGFEQVDEPVWYC